jgi:hypothetical protein
MIQHFPFLRLRGLEININFAFYNRYVEKRQLCKLLKNEEQQFSLTMHPLVHTNELQSVLQRKEINTSRHDFLLKL